MTSLSGVSDWSAIEPNKAAAIAIPIAKNKIDPI
jgi:hypothetical protein